MAADIVLYDNGARTGDIDLRVPSSQTIVVSDTAVVASFLPTAYIVPVSVGFNVAIRNSGSNFNVALQEISQTQIINVSDTARITSAVIDAACTATVTLTLADVASVASSVLTASVTPGAVFIAGGVPASVSSTALTATVTPGERIIPFADSRAPGLLTTKVTGAFDAGAFSTQGIAGDGYLEFTVGEDNTSRVIGLSTTYSSGNRASINYGIFINTTGDVVRYESNTSSTIGSYVIGDVFRLTRTGTTVTIHKNGSLLYTFGSTSTGTLYIDVGFFTSGTIQKDIRLYDNGTRVDLTWAQLTNMVDTIPTGWMLQKTSNSFAYGIAGNRSVQVFSGDFILEFTKGELLNNVIGMSADNPDNDFTTIDYAWVINANGTLSITENSSSKIVPLPVSYADVIQIRRVGSTVSYWHNGVLRYTSQTTTSADLMIDSAFGNANSTIQGIQVFQNGIPQTITWQDATQVYAYYVSGPPEVPTVTSRVLDASVNRTITLADTASIASSLPNATIVPVVSLNAELATTVAYVYKPTVNIVGGTNPFDIELRDNGTPSFNLAFDDIIEFTVADRASVVTGALAAQVNRSVALTDVAQATSTALNPTVTATVTISVADTASIISAAITPAVNQTTSANVATATSAALSAAIVAGSVTITLADTATIASTAVGPLVNQSTTAVPATVVSSALSATATPGAATITLGDLASVDSSTLDPTIVQTISAGPASVTSSALNPTVTVGASTISVGDTASISSSAVTPLVSQVITVTSAQLVSSANDPTVTAGAVTLTVGDSASVSSTVIDAQLVQVTTASPASIVSTALDPTITAGAFTVSVGDTAVVNSGVLSPKQNVSIPADAASVDSTAIDPTITATVTITADAVSTISAALDADIVSGTVTLTPAISTIVTSAVDPNVVATVTVVPSPAEAEPGALEATLIASTTLVPNPASVTATVVDGDLLGNDAFVTADVCSVVAVALEAAILSSVRFEPDPLTLQAVALQAAVIIFPEFIGEQPEHPAIPKQEVELVDKQEPTIYNKQGPVTVNTEPKVFNKKKPNLLG